MDGISKTTVKNVRTIILSSKDARVFSGLSEKNKSIVSKELFLRVQELKIDEKEVTYAQKKELEDGKLIESNKTLKCSYTYPAHKTDDSSAFNSSNVEDIAVFVASIDPSKIKFFSNFPLDSEIILNEYHANKNEKVISHEAFLAQERHFLVNDIPLGIEVTNKALSDIFISVSQNGIISDEITIDQLLTIHNEEVETPEAVSTARHLSIALNSFLRIKYAGESNFDPVVVAILSTPDGKILVSHNKVKEKVYGHGEKKYMELGELKTDFFEMIQEMRVGKFSISKKRNDQYKAFVQVKIDFFSKWKEKFDFIKYTSNLTRLYAHRNLIEYAISKIENEIKDSLDTMSEEYLEKLNEDKSQLHRNHVKIKKEINELSSKVTYFYKEFSSKIKEIQGIKKIDQKELKKICENMSDLEILLNSYLILKFRNANHYESVGKKISRKISKSSRYGFEDRYYNQEEDKYLREANKLLVNGIFSEFKKTDIYAVGEYFTEKGKTAHAEVNCTSYFSKNSNIISSSKGDYILGVSKPFCYFCVDDIIDMLKDISSSFCFYTDASSSIYPYASVKSVKNAPENIELKQLKSDFNGFYNGDKRDIHILSCSEKEILDTESKKYLVKEIEDFSSFFYIRLENRLDHRNTSVVGSSRNTFYKGYSDGGRRVHESHRLSIPESRHRRDRSRSRDRDRDRYRDLSSKY